MSHRIAAVDIRYENDVVLARQRTRQLTSMLGFDAQDQVRLSTAVSELVRNVFNYAGSGTIEFSLEGKTPPQVLIIRIADQGPGIQNIDEILEGRYRSPTGMGLGILGARRLVDQFEIKTAPNAGTTVVLKKVLSKRAAFVTPLAVGKIAQDLIDKAPQNPLEEVRRQNQELLATLAELHSRQQELVRLNRELEDTNRGVVALYAELDEKADSLRRADEMKSRFLSNMSHEFRTPLNSNLAILGLLMDRTDGPLTGEQARQLQFVLKNTEALTVLVNDLLDLAKIEAGKIVVRPIEFEVKDLFSALRGMLKPLLVNQSVALEFEEPINCPTLYTDEGKVSQILKNFISNALKFTERGHIMVAVKVLSESNAVQFSVTDTGIGIALEDQPLIFKEFHQVENALQRKVKGTGLGLPLSRKLAELLGGSASVESTPGIGSKFSAIIPVHYGRPQDEMEIVHVPPPDLSRHAVLFIEDSEETRLVFEKFLRGTPFQFIGARSQYEAQRILETIRPKAIVLDVVLDGSYTWSFLAQIKGDNATREIPVLVVTTLDDQPKAAALGADRFGIKPVDRYWLLEQLDSLINEMPVKRALLIADRHSVRMPMRRALEELQFLVAETNGSEACDEAAAKGPQVIFIDVQLEGIDAANVLGQLKGRSETTGIPIVLLGDPNATIPDQFSGITLRLNENDNSETFLSNLKEALKRIW